MLVQVKVRWLDQKELTVMCELVRPRAQRPAQAFDILLRYVRSEMENGEESQEKESRPTEPEGPRARAPRSRTALLHATRTRHMHIRLSPRSRRTGCTEHTYAHATSRDATDSIK